MGESVVTEKAYAMLKGQAEIWEILFGFVESMAMKSAVELRIPDIIHSHGSPISLSQIASEIDSPNGEIDTNCLVRIMRLLVRKKIFTAQTSSNGAETLYGITSSSKWLLHDAELSLAPMVLMQNHPWQLAPWHCLSRCVKEGGVAYEKAHGCGIWDFAANNPEFNKIFNDAMTCTAKITIEAVIGAYGDSFGRIGSMVDVGGGIGCAMAAVARAFPHIKCVNFDLPHVIATAPVHDGVSHVGGDMFVSIPKADAIFMKWILHDWNDEDCVKILKNCRKAIPEKTGKVIIVEVVLEPQGSGLFAETGLMIDLVMIAHTTGGRERTELEWKTILQKAGFPRYNIIKIPALQSIIEGFLQ
ncbi:O-methyltransferase domain [Dillenia turbinata]|uniref:O-methyltransferase domain n=1 Tax=Dillenia turbinata TaxID=194707 RepID=A0AAN8UWW8_9MAGN